MRIVSSNLTPSAILGNHLGTWLAPKMRTQPIRLITTFRGQPQPRTLSRRKVKKAGLQIFVIALL